LEEGFLEVEHMREALVFVAKLPVVLISST